MQTTKRNFSKKSLEAARNLDIVAILHLQIFEVSDTSHFFLTQINGEENKKQSLLHF